MELVDERCHGLVLAQITITWKMQAFRGANHIEGGGCRAKGTIGFSYPRKQKRRLQMASNRYVRNVDDTSELTCPCGSWTAHYNSELTPAVVCQALGCANTDIEGCHVEITKPKHEGVWIAMLCHGHNMVSSSVSIPLNAGVRLVSADPDETCLNIDDLL
jgi:hypothetical protein